MGMRQQKYKYRKQADEHIESEKNFVPSGEHVRPQHDATVADVSRIKKVVGFAVRNEERGEGYVLERVENRIGSVAQHQHREPQ